MYGPALVGYAVVQFVSLLAVTRLLNSGAEIDLSIEGITMSSKRCCNRTDRQLIVAFQSRRQSFVVVNSNPLVDRSARQEVRGNEAELYRLSVKFLVAFKRSKLTVHDVLFRNAHLIVDKAMLLDIIA
jgi:hypothetical protein